MRLDAYANWAAREVSVDAAGLTSNWASSWGLTLSSMRSLGVFEHAALILAKWEFLGGLYNGAKETSAKDARDYCRKFLPTYEVLQNLSGRAEVHSDLFSMFRNRALHGYTPAAVRVGETEEVTGWSFGKPHLEKDADGNLAISPERLEADFVASVKEYSAYLARDASDPGDPHEAPCERWRRGFWMRFCPIVPRKDWPEWSETWFAEGRRRELFT